MLRGSNIHIRTVRKKDLEAVYDLSCEIENRGPYFPLTLTSESAFLERFGKDGFWTDDHGMLIIVDNKSDRILGQVGFFKASHYYDAFEIGYILYDPKDRGKGIATEALKIFVKYLFELKPIHRLQVQMETANIGSRRIAEKCGFKFEGTARDAIIVNGRPADLSILSLTRADHESVG